MPCGVVYGVEGVVLPVGEVLGEFLEVSDDEVLCVGGDGCPVAGDVVCYETGHVGVACEGVAECCKEDAVEVSILKVRVHFGVFSVEGCVRPVR